MVNTSNNFLFNESKIHFNLKRMEDLHDADKNNSNIPHRHNYYTFIWPLKTVKGKHIIDFHEYFIKKSGIFFIQPGQVHHMITLERPRGFVITFSPEFLTKAKIEKRFIDNLKVYNSFLNNEPLFIDGAKEKKLRSFINSIIDNQNSVNQYRDEILGAYLKLFLIECTSVCDAEIKPSENKSKLITNEFKDLVEEYFTVEHKVQFYAKKMLISPGHLNNIIKKELGVNAKNFMQERITLEAKRLILFSEFNAKEIGYHLGFNDPHHFSKFIKKQTGLTISNFLRRYKKLPA